jgi:hypothetical protein
MGHFMHVCYPVDPCRGGVPCGKASGVRIHDVTVNAPADPRFRRLAVAFYEPDSDYQAPAPFLFKPALPLLLGTGGTHETQGSGTDEMGGGAAGGSDLDRLLCAFTAMFWEELSAGG